MADGAEGIHIREMVAAMRSLGHEVRVVALAGDPTNTVTGERLRIRALRRLIPSFAYEAAEIAYNEVGCRRLVEAIRTFRPAAIYDRYNAYSTAALRAARRTKIPLLLEVNAPAVYERSVYEHLQLKLPSLAKRYERRILGGADCVFVVSTPLKRYLVEVIGIEPAKVIVLPNGADPHVFCPQNGESTRHRYGLDGRIVVGFVGVLREWHGVELLLQAVGYLRHRHPSIQLLLVGDGPIRPQVEAQIRDLEMAANVIITGRVGHREVIGLIGAMDVCVSPDATFYASPMKLLEYMSMQKPVVAPDMENIRDIVEHERTGLLFEPRSIEALAGAIERFVLDRVLSERLADAARQSVVTRFNWRNNAMRVQEMVHKLG